MWLMPGRAPCHKTLPQYSLLTLLERECYEVEVQHYWNTDYKPMIYIYIYIYTVICSSVGSCGMYDAYMLKSVGKITPRDASFKWELY